MHPVIDLVVLFLLWIISKMSQTWPSSGTTVKGHHAKRKPGLPDQIHDAFEISEFGYQSAKFLPEGCIERLITNHNMESIKKIMGNQKFEQQDLLINHILRHARRVFAIAVHSGIHGNDLVMAMEILRQHRISDENLPLTDEILRQLQMLELTPEDMDVDLDVYSEPVWTNARIGNFCDNQWKFLAPVFYLDKINHDVCQHDILPFTKKVQIRSGSGSYGKVFQCKIHPSHMRATQHSTEDFQHPQYVAVKEMQPLNPDYYKTTRKVWDNEVDILHKMNSLKEHHIVQFFTAFRRGGLGYQDHYLMFEYATGGNLRQLWKDLPSPELTPELLRDAVGQLQGLADALKAAHDPSIGQTRFRHGDLKPENILCFNDDGAAGGSRIGRLKIADWGLAKQHAILTEMRKTNTTTPTGTRLYEPPEEITGEIVNRDTLTPGETIKRRSRLCDIWAMGCIILEFLIWLMYGYDELQEFARSLGVSGAENYARFFQILNKDGKNTAHIHEVVLHYMNHMAKDAACKDKETALGDLLDMVKTRLLVVKLPQRLATKLIQVENNAAATDLPSNLQNSDLRLASVITNENLNTDALTGTSGPGFQLIVDPATNQVPSSAEALAGIDPLPVARSSQRGMERALASGFQDHMLLISGDEHSDEDEYWMMSSRGRPPSETFRRDAGEGTAEGVQAKTYLLSPNSGEDVTRNLVTGIKRVR